MKFIPRTVFMLCILVSACLAASVTPLLRRRMGLLTSAVHGVAGVVVAAMIVGAVMDGPFGGAAQLALSCLFCSVAAQFVFALFRLYSPASRPDRHLHRWSPGEPWPWLAALYALAFRSFAGRAHAIAMIAEPALLLGIALALASAEPPPPVGSTAAATGLGVWCWPALGALGCLLHATALRTRDAWRVQVVLDHEMDQQGLAQSLDGRAISSALRDAEGFAEISGAERRRERLMALLRHARSVLMGLVSRLASLRGRVPSWTTGSREDRP